MQFEVAHQMSLLPIIAMMVWGRNLPAPYWLIAWAFFVSWFADSAQHFIGGSWEGGFFYRPVQTWLVLLAFIKSPFNRICSGVGMVGLALVSASLNWPGPDYLITTLGSLAILSVARGKLAIPLHIYFGYGTVAYVLMAQDITLPAWCTYQACRLGAFVVFIGIIAPPLIRKWRV